MTFVLFTPVCILHPLVLESVGSWEFGLKKNSHQDRSILSHEYTITGDSVKQFIQFFFTEVEYHVHKFVDES